MGAVAVPLNTAYAAADQLFTQIGQPTLFLARPDHLQEAAQVAAAAGYHHVATLGIEEDGTYSERVVANRTPLRTCQYWSGRSCVLALHLRNNGSLQRRDDHRGNLLANAQALATAWHLSAQDTLVHVLPLFHVHGLFLSLNALFAVGGSVRVHRRFDPVETLTSLMTGSVFMGVRPVTARLLACDALSPASVTECSAIRFGISPFWLKPTANSKNRTGKVILERTGMTETLVNTSNPYDGPRKPGSVGLPLPGVKLRLADAITSDDGQSILG
jgi:malonyl-CoA/methylmalonyl-CoA synthetase